MKKSRFIEVVENVISSSSFYINLAEETSSQFGIRCLLASPEIVNLAASIQQHSSLKSLLADLVPVQAIYFKKTLAQNWKVSLHQDSILPIDGTGSWKEAGIKEGKRFKHVPSHILDQCIVVRISLDEVPEGDLMILSDRATEQSIVQSQRIYVPQNGALIMKPSTIHGSTKLQCSETRRVIHLLYGPKELPENYKWEWVA